MNKSIAKKKLHKDNRGSGLVMVLIMVAFLGLLSGILLIASYGGYKMRLIDKEGKSNFYTAETVLDEINVGLQVQVSNALSKAYSDVMVNYSLYATPEARAQKLHQIYYTELQAALRDLTVSTYNIDLLRSFVSEELLGDGASADGSRAEFGTYGAIIESNIGADIYTMVSQDNGIVLKDLKITYVDQRGNVSIITTDIRLVLPNVNFSQSSTFPDLSGFCFIADEEVHLGNTFATGDINVKGSGYAGAMMIGAQTVTDFTGTTSIFVPGTTVGFNGPTTPGSDYIMMVSKNDVIVEKATLETTTADLWGKNILLNSAKLDLSGNTYVQNDMKLNGTNSEAILAGTYSGFGTANTQADSSSAIVINGRQSSLDLSGLNTLNVGGHTFVSTSTEGLKEEDETTNISKDILMGESVAVKSNQLVYMVPPEALGCEILEDGTAGESVYASNPMRMSQYTEIKNNPEKYVMLAADKPIGALGGKKLSEYMVLQNIAGGTPDYRPMVVVKQTAEGESLVYCYMQFKDESAANQYFADYYHVNAASVEQYTRIYAEAIKMPADVSSLLYLHLAGNVLAYDGAGAPGRVIGATDSEAQKNRAEALALTRNDTFKALTCKMVTNLAQLTAEEQTRTVFNNIVDDVSLTQVVKALRTNPSDDTVVLESADSSKLVVLGLGNYTVTDDRTRMVVCKGDVRIKKDYTGIIVAGGDVIISDENDLDKNVELSPLTMEEFSQLLLINKDSGGMDYYVLDVFRDGVNQAHNSGGSLGIDVGTQQVVMSDLIVYERWSKQ